MIIYTHSGRFHADEVIACALIQLAHRFQPIDIKIIRTRDPKLLAAADGDTHVVDVGGEYDPDRNRFDHHQPEFDEKYPGSTTRMSSAGLVWLKYRDTLATPIAHAGIYRRVVAGIDAHDNGVPYLSKGQKTNYEKLGVGLVISAMNSSDTCNHVTQLKLFNIAVEYARQTIQVMIESEEAYHHHVLENTIKVREAIPNASEGVLVIEDKLTGDVRVDHALANQPGETAVKFIVTPREPDEGTWSIWTRKKPGSQFGLMIPILTEEKAKAIVGDDLVFVHRAGFVGATRSRDSAIKLAKASASECSGADM
jgi:uncharacterized UPF0160 family protein